MGYQFRIDIQNRCFEVSEMKIQVRDGEVDFSEKWRLRLGEGWFLRFGAARRFGAFGKFCVKIFSSGLL